MRKILILTSLALATSVASITVASAKTTAVETKRDGRTIVSAPGTRVAVEPKGTRVRVEAPLSDVKVDTAKRTVRVRVPFYNGDITW